MRLATAAKGAERMGAAVPSNLLRALRSPKGLRDRPWFKIRLWAPGIEKGYGADTFPELRAARLAGDEARFERALEGLTSAIAELAQAWAQQPRRANTPAGTSR